MIVPRNACVPRIKARLWVHVAITGWTYKIHGIHVWKFYIGNTITVWRQICLQESTSMYIPGMWIRAPV